MPPAPPHARASDASAAEVHPHPRHWGGSPHLVSGGILQMGILEEGAWGRALIRTEWVGRGRGWRNPDAGVRTVPAENSEGREHRFSQVKRRDSGAERAGAGRTPRPSPDARGPCGRPSRRFQHFRCPPQPHTTHLSRASSAAGALRPHPWAPKPGQPGPQAVARRPTRVPQARGRRFPVPTRVRCAWQRRSSREYND